MQRFRARKTKGQLQRRGSPRARNRVNEPDLIDPAGMICPKDYSPLETEIWNNYFRLLTATRTLSQSDAAILDIFVRTYAELMEMENFLKVNGKSYTAANGREYNRPQIAIRNDARRELRGLLIQLGATSASRGHVETIKKAGLNNYGLEKWT